MLLAVAPHDRAPPNTDAGIRHRLKAATAQAHQALDEGLGRFDLTEAGSYRRFLEINAAALLPLEDALERSHVSDVFPDWSVRSRRAAINADLAQLGGVVEPLPVSPGQIDRAGLFGTLYVLEGSRLGGAYLLRAASASQDPQVRAATSYLSHGAGQSLWRSFLARLEGEPVTPDDEARMIASAQLAFGLFAEAAALA